MIKKGARYGILLVVLLALGGCSMTPDRSDKPSPDWSRGLRVGVASVNQPVALQVDGKEHAHLVWYTKTDEVDRLRYVQLDEQANVLVDRDLDISMPYPHRPQLLLDGRGNIHLAWLARDDSLKSLFHFLLGDNGEAISEPVRLSLPEKGVESYQMCLGEKGRIEVFWAAEEGIYHLRLDERGEILSPSALIIPQGTDPTAQVDDAGTIHLAWLQGNEIYYAAFEAPEPIRGNKVAQLGRETGAILRGPTLGLDVNNVYVFWSFEKRSGLEPGTARMDYVSFLPGQPSSPKTSAVMIPPIANPDYVPDDEGAYHYQWLASPLGEWSSDFTHMPAPAAGQRSEIAVALGVKVQTASRVASGRFRPQVQLAVAIFADGELRGYQIAANTKTMSLRPSIAVDSASDLHLAWIDTAGFWRYDVYYATTSPQARAWLDRTSPQDVLLRGLDMSWGMFSAIVLVPLTVVWIFPPLFWIVLYYIFSGQDDLRTRRAQVALGIAVVLYLGAKLLLLPGLLLYVPFLEQVPARFSSAIVLGLPLVTLAFALVVVYAYARRAEGGTLFKGFIILALTDALLSLTIYSLGVFAGY